MAAREDKVRTTDELLTASLRLRPDRLIVGEVRGKEAMTFLEAINTGHGGSMTTLHAETPQLALARLAIAGLKAQLPMTYQDMTSRAHDLQACFTAVAEIPKPTVAAITGYALGGGMELAMCCDIRIAGDNAKVGQPEVLLGIIPGGGGTQRLARLVGPAKAKDINFTGRFVDADEALRIGMIDKVVAPDEVHAAAKEWAGQFRNSASLALRAIKAAVDGGLNGDLATGLKLESNLFASLFASDDQKIGMKSFVENGPGKAQFTGK